MNAREEAEKRLSGQATGQPWHQVDAIRGVGWALLAVAEAITAAAAPAASADPHVCNPLCKDDQHVMLCKASS